MTDSHTALVKTGIETTQSNEYAVANATAWLIEEVGEVDVIQEAHTRTWKGNYNVHFRAILEDSQVEAIKNADSMTYLGE